MLSFFLSILYRSGYSRSKPEGRSAEVIILMIILSVGWRNHVARCQGYTLVVGYNDRAVDSSCLQGPVLAGSYWTTFSPGVSAWMAILARSVLLRARATVLTKSSKAIREVGLQGKQCCPRIESCFARRSFWSTLRRSLQSALQEAWTVSTWPAVRTTNRSQRARLAA